MVKGELGFLMELVQNENLLQKFNQQAVVENGHEFFIPLIRKGKGILYLLVPSIHLISWRVL